jgi:hypothetical protein
MGDASLASYVAWLGFPRLIQLQEGNRVKRTRARATTETKVICRGAPYFSESSAMIKTASIACSRIGTAA